MDWKPFYRAEAESAAGRDRIRAAVEAHPDGDAEARRVLRDGGAISFPHTSLAGSAEPLARVATSVLAEGFARVVALGVLHGSVLPEPERGLAAAAATGDARAMEAVGGAWTVAADADTPFGRVPSGPLPAAGPWLRPGGRLLAREFSLDLFLAVLAHAAAAGGVPPPPVSCVYVGPTDPALPDGPVAAAVARALSPLLGPGTALVATGDLVHAGHGYAPEAEVAALPEDPGRLRAHFEPRVARLLEATLSRPGGAAAADALARELRSDQRNLAPVLAAILGPGARARILSFALTSYAEVLGHPPPCVVASALVAIERGEGRIPDRGPVAGPPP